MHERYDALLSHNSVDKPHVRRIADNLTARGLNVWWDEDALPPGMPYLPLLDAIVKQTRAAAVFVGDAGLGPWQRLEIAALLSEFTKRKLPVIPVLLPGAPAGLKPDLPDFLDQFTYVDARNGMTDSVIGRLEWGIRQTRPAGNFYGTFEHPRHTQATEHRTEVEVVIPGAQILIEGHPFSFVPAGKGVIGSDDGYPHEAPQHEVALSSFFMCSIPITNHLFEQFVRSTKYVTDAEVAQLGLTSVGGDVWDMIEGADWRHPQGLRTHLERKANHPVLQISWTDARNYCTWLSSITGLHISLPTEVQWEYAARGTNGTKWSFGEDYKPGMANIHGSDTTPVGQYPANRLGLFDMCGNVYEWCSDWHSESWLLAGHNLNHPSKDPMGPASGRARMLRGGSWRDSPHHCRAANRFWAPPDMSSSNWGFRCSITLNDFLIRILTGLPKWGITAEDMIIGRN